MLTAVTTPALLFGRSWTPDRNCFAPSGAAESGVGEVPEAANESCEDIMPPNGEDAFEKFGRGLGGFAPTAISLRFEG